ncbi:helix-turn-helix domain-containing protein [Kitasatospora sp. NPDC088134]|uniref:TetR/AcrR family transcriptional regulator n=1 Tax=Kitasatospora sp. NPDC088134 TaxID=3364071 RepID=UPI0038233AD1
MTDRVVPETARRRRRPTKQGTVLSEQVIVDTALRLVEQHGAQAFSVRRLGLALGADPSAIYRYFRNTDALLIAVADELIGLGLRGWEPTGDWRADLREVGLRIHTRSCAHPQAAVLAAYRTTGRAHEIRAIETMLGILREAGFPGQDAVALYHAFIDQALGFAVLDAAALAMPAPAQDADQGVWDTAYRDLPADTHPHIAATADLLAAHMRRSAYPLALDLLLDAFAGRLPAA